MIQPFTTEQNNIADPNLLQQYIILTTEELQKIGELFGAYDRENIQEAIKRIISEYIQEHTQEQVQKKTTEIAWKTFEQSFNAGMFMQRRA